MVARTRVSAVMSSNTSIEPIGAPSGPNKGCAVRLTETEAPANASRASIAISRCPVCAIRPIEVMTQAFSPENNSAAGVPTTASSCIFRISSAASLAVTTRPSLSRVIMPFEVLRRMFSL